jgi:site-specific recombinase XerD
MDDTLDLIISPEVPIAPGRDFCGDGLEPVPAKISLPTGGPLPQLCFTDLSSFSRTAKRDGLPLALTAEEQAGAAFLGLVDGMPFILGDDGSYDHHLNRFFRACPTLGVRSMNSLRAYARDILVWMRFLQERCDGKSLWAACREDIAAFHEARRLSDPPFRISAASWNRAVASLDKLYRWALDEKIITSVPFAYRQSWAYPSKPALSQPGATNTARERGARKGDVRFLDLEGFKAFRDVGLRGRLPDGREDPAWRGRNGERNALFAELLITTGLRLQEASSLMLMELPDLASMQGQTAKSVAFRLAAATAKGGRGREIRLPVRLIAELRALVAIERDVSLGRNPRKGMVQLSERAIAVAGYEHRALRIGPPECASRMTVDQLSAADRHRLVDAATGAPLTLWLTEDGRSMSMAAWEAVFLRASARCREMGFRDMHVTPHMLRHSFAVHMLNLLLREQIGWVTGEADRPFGAAWRRVIGDPLLKLQRLMGHARIESTYIYLDHLAEAQEIVDAAVDAFDLGIASKGKAR